MPLTDNAYNAFHALCQFMFGAGLAGGITAMIFTSKTMIVKVVLRKSASKAHHMLETGYIVRFLKDNRLSTLQMVTEQVC